MRKILFFIRELFSHLLCAGFHRISRSRTRPALRRYARKLTEYWTLIRPDSFLLACPREEFKDQILTRVPLGAFADLLQRRQELRDVESGESNGVTVQRGKSEWCIRRDMRGTDTSMLFYRYDRVLNPNIIDFPRRMRMPYHEACASSVMSDIFLLDDVRFICSS